MRILMVPAALSAVILAFAAGGRAEAFDQASLQGTYSTSLSGFVEGKAPLLPLPWWAVGVIQFDGAGQIVATESVVNVIGCLILKQTGTGTYSVNPNGTGRGEMQLTSETVSTVKSDLCSTVNEELFVANFQEAFDFAINAGGLDMIITSWEGPNGPIAIASSGQATPQVRASARAPRN